MHVTTQAIETAYSALRAALQKAHHTGQASIEAKTRLERRKLAALAAGSLTGKNSEEREAAARERFGDLYTELEEAERTAADAKLDLDLARLEVDRVRCLLRLAELTAAPPN